MNKCCVFLTVYDIITHIGGIDMNLFICLFIPGMIAYLMYEKITKVNYDLKHSVMIYMIFTLFINITATVASNVLFDIDYSIESAITNFPIFAVKYVIISVLFALLLPAVVNWLANNISIRISIKKDNRENNKKNSKSK